jgi:adenylate cyclase
MKIFGWIKKIFTLSAFKIGLLTTLAFFYIGYKYYTTPLLKSESNPILNILNIAHQKSIDIRMTSRGEIPVSDKIAILAVDEDSIERFGRWPWSRDLMAKILNSLRDNDISAVGLDIIFSEKETCNSNDNLLAESIESLSDKVVLGTYFDQNYDFEPFQEACSQAIDESNPEYATLESQENPIVLIDQVSQEFPSSIQDFLKNAMAKITTDIEQNSAGLYPQEIRKKIIEAKEKLCLNFLISPQSIDWIQKNWLTFQTQNEELKDIDAKTWIENLKTKLLRNPIHHAGKFWVNVPEISSKAKHYAYFNAFLDSDGYIRRTKLFTRYGNMIIPSLALKTVLTAQNRGAMVVLNEDPNNPNSKKVSELTLTNVETGDPLESIPVDGEGRLNINYAGPQKMFPYISVNELLNKSDKMYITQRSKGSEKKILVDKKDFLKHRIVFFGATAVGIYDLRVTPFAENFPGVETHANIAENIIQKQFFQSISDEPIYMLLFILVFGLLLSYGIARTGAINGSVITIIALLSTYYVDKYVLFSKGIVIVIVFPLLLTLLIYIFLTFYKYLTEERKKKELKHTFQKYVSPAVVNEILSHPEKINLGGRKENMTVMFSDVRGFTTLAEKLDPQVLGTFLNRYLTPMTRLVFKNNGTLDKYIGDAIMAFFGAPISDKSHAKKCCTTALEMLEKLKDLNAEFAKEQLPPLDIGVGINSGDMSVGNMGSDIVRSYTVMGDAVNLASRLEGINKNYGTRIIISEFTFAQIKDDFIARELDWVRVKGKLLPVKIYELISNKKLDPNFKQGIDYFSSGFEQYHSKLFKEALQNFSSALNKIPDDVPSQLYVERCQEYMRSPPSENWDGVYEFTTK